MISTDLRNAAIQHMLTINDKNIGYETGDKEHYAIEDINELSNIEFLELLGAILDCKIKEP